MYIAGREFEACTMSVSACKSKCCGRPTASGGSWHVDCNWEDPTVGVIGMTFLSWW